MTNLQVNQAVKAQKEAARRRVLTYRGVQYIRKDADRWAPTRG